MPERIVFWPKLGPEQNRIVTARPIQSRVGRMRGWQGCRGRGAVDSDID